MFGDCLAEVFRIRAQVQFDPILHLKERSAAGSPGEAARTIAELFRLDELEE